MVKQLESDQDIGLKPHFCQNYYHLQTKFTKVMFLHLSVSHFVHGEGQCLPQCMLGYTPLWAAPHWADTLREADTPWEQTSPRGDTPLCSACWEIWATSGRYASYWNAYMFLFNSSNYTKISDKTLMI